MNMQEKRRSKRLPVKLQLMISSLFKQDNVMVNDIQAPIEVTDISRDGIGFQSASVLPLDFYFNAKITLGDADSKLYCVIKIVRVDDSIPGIHIYGCEFVGMSPVLSYIFEDYEEKLDTTP